ncbi:MAC/perforin domain-containing protein [Bacteroides sp.]|jgi:hypothetical protein|uniref:MAC/perforin domain-containing protein n=1 Tax=Bacteroides sp. TaxID=29523 RepID=UPI003AB3C9FC
MRKLFYFILAACTLHACSSDSDPDNGGSASSDFYELNTIPDKEVAFKAYPINAKQILGAGYDVAADYLSPEAIKAPVIDLDKIDNSDDADITRIRALASSPKDYAGADATAFLADITQSMKLDGINAKNPLFTGTIMKHKEFQSDYDHSTQFSFASSEQIFTVERWYFTPFYISERDRKYSFLTQEFEDDVKSLAAGDIIKKYGTHLLMDVGIGARYRGLYRTSVPTATSASEVGRITYLTALKKIGEQGLFTGSGAGGWEDEIAQSVGGQLVIEFFGGDTSLLSSHPSAGEVDAWWSSFNDENYTLTEIIRNALPIYEMIKDAAKKEQVKNAVNEYVANQKITAVSTLPLLQAWSGKTHTYHTSYPDCAASSSHRYEGAVCSIYGQQRKNTVPLYLYSNKQKQRLSTEALQEDADWVLEKELGYVYTSPAEGAIPLYEAENKNDYCYTTEDKQTYGTEGSWKKVGIACYVLPL